MPVTPNQLFSPADIEAGFGRVVAPEQSEFVERIVWGWLKGPASLADRPNPTPDDLWAWAVELAAIYLENPTGLSAKELGPARAVFSSERRGQILSEVAANVAGGGTSPRGSFPAASTYPDPALRC